MKSVHHETLRARLPQGLPEFEGVFRTLSAFIEDAPAQELLEINPKTLARRKKLDFMHTLKALLHLTKAGIFDLTWAVRCPHCKGPTHRAETLHDLKEHARCELCNDDFDAGFDNNVALSFRVAPAVATVSGLSDFETALALAGFEFEPGMSVTLEPGERHDLVLDVKEGNYGLVRLGGGQMVNITVAPGNAPPNQSVELAFDEQTPLIQSVPLVQGSAAVSIVNRGTETMEFLMARMVRPDWTDAALVTTLQEFRDLFSEEMLSPSESFSIRTLSFIFTDLKSSTEMYERLGDSKAFYLVKEHFKIMEDVVRGFDGGVVKTIGDAVMAVFQTPTQALGAARAMVERFEDYNREHHTQNQIIVKVGVHSGPCIAVTLNDKLDYFGTSVNIAARVQGLSDGRTVMVSDSVFREGRSDDSSRWEWERFETSLKGLKDRYTVHKGALKGA
jgi:class 3 adenylate cyclase